MCKLLSIGMWLGILAISTSSIEAKSTQQDIRKVIKSCHEASVPADCLLLGNSLARSGGVQLAIPAYLKALTIWTRESAPQDWAMVNHNLGTSLIALGYDESDLNTIHMGVDHLKEALKERTSDRTPLKWAATQHALGRAYTRLGELESNSQRFDEAMAFFELALQERTRESYPLKWADTKVGIGRLMSLQAIQLSSQQGTERLEQALKTFKDAEEEITYDVDPWYWAIIQTEVFEIEYVYLGKVQQGSLTKDIKSMMTVIETLHENQGYRPVSQPLSRSEAVLSQMESLVVSNNSEDAKAE